MLDRFFTWFSSVISFAAGQPLAFMLAISTVLAWAITGPLFAFSDTWQLVINTGTTIVTFLMVFLIQNSTNRDAAAMQAKLDELLRAVARARGEFIGIEHLSERQLEEIRDALEREAGTKADKGGPAKKGNKSVEQLLKRR
jgi:low affinity Fe/Cu permease